MSNSLKKMCDIKRFDNDYEQFFCEFFHIFGERWCMVSPIDITFDPTDAHKSVITVYNQTGSAKNYIRLNSNLYLLFEYKTGDNYVFSYSPTTYAVVKYNFYIINLKKLSLVDCRKGVVFIGQHGAYGGSIWNISPLPSHDRLWCSDLFNSFPWLRFPKNANIYKRSGSDIIYHDGKYFNYDVWTYAFNRNIDLVKY